jgi:hypothetical protein
MSFFSSVVGAVKKVGKVATLPITAPIKLQAQLASKLLPVVARAVPGPSLFGRSSGSSSSSSSAPAAPTGWRGTSLIAPALRASPPPASSSVSYDSGQTTPAQSSWFPSIAAAVQAAPQAQQAPSPYYPGAAPAPYVPGGVPGGTPLSYAQPGYQPSSGYGGGSYGGGGGYDDGIDVPDDGSIYPASSDADVYDQEGAELADLNAYAQLADDGMGLGDDGSGLGDWKSALTNIVKGAASGALTQTVSALTPKPAAPKPGLLSGGGMSTGAKVAIGVAVAAPLAYLALRHRAAPARARNPRRRRRRSRRR